MTPYLPLREPLQLTWHAPWLDRVWDLTDPTSPVYKVFEAVRPGRTDGIHQLHTAAMLNGAQWQRYRVPEGEHTHVIAVEAVDTAAFDLAHSEFMDSLTEDYEGVLRWTKPDGTWREILARYRSGADQNGLEGDPFVECRAMYPITWLAADPFWRGPDVVAPYPYSPGVPLFPGPPFTIGPGQVLGYASVENPGDVESYPVWRIDGPFTGFSVGVGDALAEMTLTKTAGQWVEIDMDPTRLTVLDESGADRWTALTAVEFTGIPRGVSDLVATAAGAAVGTSVTLSFTPRYRAGY